MSSALAAGLRRNMIKITAASRLEILTDQESHKLAEKLYRLVQPDDYSQRPIFFQELDTLLQKYADKEASSETEDSEPGKSSDDNDSK